MNSLSSPKDVEHEPGCPALGGIGTRLGNTECACRVIRMLNADDWQPMDTAPKDGTEITLRLRHQNYAYCKTDRERAMWQQDVTAHWIDHNDGGWTWHGMYGNPIAWKPLPSPPDSPDSSA